MAAIDPVAYVRSIQPFRALPKALFDQVAGALEVAFFPSGTCIAQTGGTPLQHLYVIRKGVVRLDRHGRNLQVLEEGELFGYTSLITHEATLDVVAEEDVLAYRLPGTVFERLLSDAQFASHFALGLSERLKASLDEAPVSPFQPDLAVRVDQLLRRPAVWVEPDATIGQAAHTMGEERISSVLVRTRPPGIVTDRDLRTRVLGAGLGPDVPVTKVMTQPLRTAPAETPLYDAWSVLLEHGLHHLPVTRDGEIVGVLTATDVLRSTSQGPVAVLRNIERLPSRASLPGYAARLTEMASSLLAGGLDAMVIAGLVARLNDALLRPILRWAEADLGPPPAPYAWIVFGSEGRMEQTLLTDQDNALVWAGGAGDVRAWFEAFATRVAADLQAAGFPECPGGYMARRWMGPLDEWTRRFASWIDEPSPEALLHAAIFFDFRRVAGTLGLSPLDAVLAEAPAKPAFLRFLARSALEFHPPPALLLRLEGGSSVVDLKAHGIAPVVFLARCYGLELGGRARSTLERIEAASAAGLLSADVHASVAEAYRFLLGLRLRLQLRALAAWKLPKDAVALAELGAVERSRLKDALRAVRVFRDGGAHHFRTDF